MGLSKFGASGLSFRPRSLDERPGLASDSGVVLSFCFNNDKNSKNGSGYDNNNNNDNDSSNSKNNSHHDNGNSNKN